MKVLIAPNFTEAMAKLSDSARREAVELYSLVSTLPKEQLVESSLLTRLDTAMDIYTLRSRSTRVFCSFSDDDTVIFLDVKEAAESPIFPEAKRSSELTLYNWRGAPQAYLATDDDNTLYSFDGRPLAYLDGENVYGFNGKHLGWFEDGIVWDHKGQRVGFVAAKCPSLRSLEPFKGFKQFKPFKSFKQFAPFKPFKSAINAKADLLEHLAVGRK